MSELTQTNKTTQAKEAGQKYRYLPPAKRPVEEPITNLDFSDTSFPELKKDVVNLPKASTLGFKQKILELIYKEEQARLLQNMVLEEDPKLMTSEQREAAGWATLPLTGNLKEAGLRFNASLN
jgi:hypothetical protein